MSQLEIVKNHIIARLAGAGVPPTSMQVQLLLVYIQAYHLSRFSSPAFDGLVERTETGIRIRDLDGHNDGGFLKPLSEADRSQYDINPYDRRPPAEMSKTVSKAAEDVLFLRGGKNGWDLQKGITGTQAWRNTPAGPRGNPNHLDLTSLAADLFPDSSLAGW